MEDTVGRVIHGDCRSIIPTLQFDYVITDPPYNIDYRYTDYADRMSDEDYVALLATLKPYRSVLIHYTEAFIGPIRDAIGIPSRTVAWCYNTPLNRQHRTIAWFGCTPDLTLVRQPYKNPNDKRVRAHVQASGSEGGKLYDWWEMPVVKNKSREKIAGFTNQIPVALLERILLITTQPGDTVLDPFFGTGSLYFACRNTGRRCIGIEQSEQHLACFQARLQRGY